MSTKTKRTKVGRPPKAVYVHNARYWTGSAVYHEIIQYNRGKAVVDCTFFGGRKEFAHGAIVHPHYAEKFASPCPRCVDAS